MLLTLIFSCKKEVKEKPNIKEVLETLENNEEQTSEFKGYFSEINREKLKLSKSDFWVEFSIDDINYIPSKNSWDNSLKKKSINDRYTKEKEIQLYELEIQTTAKNINNQYIKFVVSNLGAGRIGVQNDFNNRLDKDYVFELDPNKSDKGKIKFLGDIDETMDTLNLGPFLTFDNQGNKKKVYFRIDFDTKKVVDKIIQ